MHVIRKYTRVQSNFLTCADEQGAVFPSSLAIPKALHEMYEFLDNYGNILYRNYFIIQTRLVFQFYLVTRACHQQLQVIATKLNFKQVEVCETLFKKSPCIAIYMQDQWSTVLQSQ